MLTKTNDGWDECTTGFSVRNRTTLNEGVTSAGHCYDIFVSHPGHGDHRTTLRAQHVGDFGEFAFLHQNGQTQQPDDFYASSSSVRDVSAHEPAASISVGEDIIHYGRASNSPRTLRVRTVSIICFYLEKVVEMTTAGNLVPGDSGGPWYVGGRAYGTTIGTCAGRAMFSKAALFDNAINSDVMTSP